MRTMKQKRPLYTYTYTHTHTQTPPLSFSFLALSLTHPFNAAGNEDAKVMMPPECVCVCVCVCVCKISHQQMMREMHIRTHTQEALLRLTQWPRMVANLHRGKT
jgi:hypothetical protein